MKMDDSHNLKSWYMFLHAQRLAEALQLLCQAYDLAPGSAVVLNLLAHHCLLRGDYDKVQSSGLLHFESWQTLSNRQLLYLVGNFQHSQFVFSEMTVASWLDQCHLCVRCQAQVTALATAALQAADSERLRADAEALLARAAHAQNDLRTAFAHYRQVCCTQILVIQLSKPLVDSMVDQHDKLWLLAALCPRSFYICSF